MPHANAVKVWDAVTGQELLSQGVNSPFCVAFSPQGRQLAAGNRDRLIIVWDLSTGEERKLRGHRGDVSGLAFSPDGQRLASAAADNLPKLWDVAMGQEVLSLRGHRGLVNAVAFSPDGRRLASASEDGTVKLWEARPRGE
jgi:WD40 repeat protein